MLRRRIARPIVNHLRRPYVLKSMSRPSEVRWLGHRLRTAPDVFHPLHFSSSRILAEQILARPLRGLRLLDMGTGAGPIAIAATAAGALVTACDINPHAVALARHNLSLNGLDQDVIESDLFGALAGRVFDLICFNLPFYARDPRTPLEHAFHAGRNLETVRRFVDGCTRHLGQGGRVVVLYSEDCDRGRILDAFRDAGFQMDGVRITRSLLEDFHVAWFRR